MDPSAGLLRRVSRNPGVRGVVGSVHSERSRRSSEVGGQGGSAWHTASSVGRVVRWVPSHREPAIRWPGAERRLRACAVVTRPMDVRRSPRDVLRTTRRKELDRRFAQERQRGVKPGRTRRNLTTADKERFAKSMAPTTLFDVLWRVRKKANYEDADTFVLGAGDEVEARRLAQALVILTDGTVAALEALTAAYVGPRLLADFSQAYAARTRSEPASAVGRRASAWQHRRQGSVRR